MFHVMMLCEKEKHNSKLVKSKYFDGQVQVLYSAKWQVQVQYLVYLSTKVLEYFEPIPVPVTLDSVTGMTIW